mmetsp:Transcript_88704/g.284778  ORF Transcript_88704/g.284778 Transcript_88704/m.284778 type:complete len:148 (-) Transcript_88704:98-541(-)
MQSARDFDCSTTDVVAQACWGADQQAWCCEHRGVCLSRASSVASAPLLWQPLPAATTTTAAPPPPPPPALEFAEAVAGRSTEEATHGRCDYGNVLFAASMVQWDPPVWKYSSESGTCSALRAGSNSWEDIAFKTEAACLAKCGQARG